jgi:hypothetical protein
LVSEIGIWDRVKSKRYNRIILKKIVVNIDFVLIRERISIMRRRWDKRDTIISIAWDISNKAKVLFTGNSNQKIITVKAKLMI